MTRLDPGAVGEERAGPRSGWLRPDPGALVAGRLRPMASDLDPLIAEFTRMGIDAASAARLARADVEGDVPQRVRHALLFAAWEQVVDPAGAWIQRMADSYPAGPPLAALIDAGVDRAALTRLVRAMQFEAIAGLILALDGGAHPVSAARWRLFECDAEGRPRRPIHALHESLTGADPTGEADGWM